MPRRKQTNQTASALKKKTCSSEQYNKQKGNDSSQRFPKTKTHLNQWNYVKYTGYKNTHIENEKKEEDEEDTFGLSPAYLCECTIETQDTSVAPEDPSREYCFEKGALQTNLLKRKNLPKNDKLIKRNDTNIHNQKYSSAFLCESILQAEDTPVALGPESNSKNSLVENSRLKKKKQQHNNQKKQHCEFNDQGQEFSSRHLYRSKLQCNLTSVVSNPNPSNVPSKKRLLESNPLKKEKSQHNSKKIKLNEENNHIYEYNPSFLCESIILSEETTGISEYDPSKENCSTNSLSGRNPRKKTKPQCRSETLKSYEINNKSQKFSSKNLNKITVQSGCTLGVSKPGSSKTCSKNSFLKINSHYNKKTQHGIKVFKNNEITITQQYNLANINESTFQFKDTSVISESDPSKEYCFENKLLGNHPQDTKKPQRTRKRQKKNKINIKVEQTSLSSEKNFVVSESGFLRKFKNICLEKNLPNKKEQQNKSEELKSNEITDHPQQHDTLHLCQSTLQSDPLVLSEPGPSKKSCSENKLLESHPLDSKKSQRTSRRKKTNKIYVQAQENSSVSPCNGVLKSEDLSVILKPDRIKGRCSRTKLLKFSPLKNKKLKQNKKGDKTNSVSNSIPEYNHGFPCESTFSSEASKSMVSKSGSLRKTRRRFLETNMLNKKKQRNNIEEVKSNGIVNHSHEHSTLLLCETPLHCEDTSVHSEPDISKKFSSENKLLESHSQDTKKPLLTSKRQKNKKNQAYSPTNLSNDTSQFENFSVISKPGSLKLKCSKTRLLNCSPLKNKKAKQNKKEDKIRDVSNSIPENNHVTPCKSTLDSEDSSVVTGSDSLRKSCFENSFLENNPLKKTELQNDSEELTSNEITNHLQEHGTLHLCENTLQSQEPAAVPNSDPLTEDCSENRVSERNSWKKQKPLSYSENNEVKTNEISAALIDEIMSQAEDSSLASEYDPSIECSSKNQILEKDTLVNHEGLFHSDISVTSEVSNHNQGSSTEEINFIECNLFDHEFKHSNSTMEVDPLEWKSTVLDELECNQKDVHLNKNNQLEVNTIQNSVKIMNLSNVSDIGTLECDLHLECTLEDSEPLEPDLQEKDCNSGESNVVGSVSSSFDIKITQLPERFSVSNFELICDSGTIPTSVNGIKVTSEIVKNDREYDNKIETKHLVNMDKIKLLDNNSETMSSIKRKIITNQINVDNENLCSELKEDQMKGNHSLQCIDPKSSLQNLGELSSMNSQEDMKKTVSVVDNEIISEVSAILEQIMTIVELSEFSLSGKLNPEDEPTECCPLKIQPVDVTSCSLKDNQSMLSPLLIKNDSGIDCKMEDDENHSFGHLSGESCDENCDRASPKTLTSSGFINVSKERLNFHENRVLKVLLHRLEDEEIFKVWKKNGVISLLKRSSSKKTLGWKRTHSLGSSIQKSLKKRKNFKCWVCKKSFKSRERYWQHRASKCDRVRVFGCGNCNRKYILKKMLDEHRSKCISVIYFRCKVCLKLFNTQERLNEHYASKCDTQKAFYCDVCERGFIFKRLLLIHNTPICTSLRRYKCSICNQSFDQMNLRTHKLKEHGVGILPTVLCEFCGKMVNRRHFNDHMYIHFDNPLYRCKACSKVFRSKKARRHHEQFHFDSDTKPCICADCGKAFKRLKELKKHVSGYGNFNKCNSCGKVILNQFCFRVHVKSHIKEEDHSEEGLKYEIKQEPCNEGYSQDIKDEKPFKSSEFVEIFTERNTMEQHLQSVHQTPLYGSENKTGQYQGSLKDKSRPFKCDSCSSCFLRQKYLNQHIRKNHNALYEVKPVQEDKPFKCETCGNSFLKKVNLNRHCRRVHNAPSFVREIVKTPTEEKPYACDICKTCFKEMKGLTRHRSRVHHVNSGNLLYPCAFCDEQFQAKADFKQHTFEHFKDCFVVSSNVKEEEQLFASSDVKILRNDVKTPTQGCSVTTNVKEEEILFSNSDIKTMRNVVQTQNPPTQQFSVTPNIKQEEKLISSCDVKTTRNHVQSQNPPIQGRSVTTNVKQEEKLFSSSAIKAVRNNVQTPSQEKPYVCDICGNRFGEKRNLSRHRSRMHSSCPLHSCSFCNEKFKTDADLKDHTYEHFKNGFSVSTNVKDEGNLFIRTGLKDKSEFADGNLQQQEEDSHLKQQEEAPTSTDSKKEEDVICPDRLDESNRLAHLENNPGNSNDHKSKGYACRECGKTFYTRYSQKRHVCLHKLSALQSTIGRDVHPCEECGVIFFERSRLNTHLLSHSSLSFKCDICKKYFTTQLKLSVHMLVHGVKTSAEPTFECSTCNKLFPSSKQLENHMILHTEQNPYQCTKCSRKFTTPFALKRHNDNTHVDKRFLCNYCNMSFVSFSSLNQHVMYVHKKSVSLTEYVLKIDDDLQDQTLTEADYMTDNNLHDEGSAEVNLPAQVFTNIGNMFMYSNLFRDTPLQSEKQTGFRQDLVNTNDTPSLTREKEAPSLLEFTIKIADR